MSFRAALHELLLSLFPHDADGLRRFIAHGEEGERICHELPGPMASPAAVVEGVIDQLTARRLVRRTLARLGEEFPRRAADIARVTDAFHEVDDSKAGDRIASPSGPVLEHTQGSDSALSGDLRRDLARSLLAEPNAVLSALDVRLGLNKPASGESSEVLASRLAAAIDALGAGPAAVVRLVEACYTALSDVDVRDRPGARRILRRLLGEWLPQRYGCTLSVTPMHRTVAHDHVEDLDVDTPNREIAEPAAAFADRRRAAYATRTIVAADGTRKQIVGPRGEIPVSLADAAEILASDEQAARIAHAIADQLPSPIQATPQRKLQDTREYLAFLRDPGLAQDPKHIALTADERDGFGEDALRRLKEFFPALRIVGLGGRPGSEEARIRFRLMAIFRDDDA